MVMTSMKENISLSIFIGIDTYSKSEKSGLGPIIEHDDVEDFSPEFVLLGGICISSLQIADSEWDIFC